MKSGAFFIYDKEEDIFYVGKELDKKKISASIDAGPYVFDVGSNASIVGLEISDASEVTPFSKKLLSELKNVEFNVRYSKNAILVILKLCFPKKRCESFSTSLVVDRQVLAAGA